ncbi:tetratricopeptide repeat protein [Desulfoplanes formicivorans]|uniref:Bacteriophage N4 adsorption protein A C-terminal domain-containing protein n=1 Tax=Desulfoplanes formicivorans TaxID=1592317 RepID=A0A194AM75_9BACT|nr:tetratricopeptide repeat protein [Desulfoplanes formicivorans]GAU09749.1 hypothetical protein DPF_2481 [Desulfoplanes formicivorans]
MLLRLIATLLLTTILLPLPCHAVQSSQGSWFNRKISQLKSYPLKDRGYELLKAGKTKEAAAEFKKALELDPFDTAVRLDYCQTLETLGWYDQLLQQASELRKTAPGNVKALIWIAISYQKTGKADKAADLLVNALDSPDLPEADAVTLATMAMDLLIKQQDFEQAKVLLTAHPSAFPIGRRFFVTGLVNKGLGNDGDALQAYQQALSSTDGSISVKDRVIALSDSADIFAKQNRTEEARRSLLEAYALDPDHPSVSYRLAELARRNNDLPQALTWIDRSLKARDDINASGLKALILTDMGRQKEAMVIIDDLLTRAPDAAKKRQLLMQKGFLASSTNDNHLAATLFQQANAILDDISSLKALAKARELDGQWDAAEHAYRRLLALETTPGSRIEIRTDLAQLQLKAGKTAQAIAELNALADSTGITPEQRVNTLEQVAYLHYQNKEYTKAEQTFTKIVRLRPGNRQASLGLVRSALKSGKYDKAQTVLEDLTRRTPDVTTLTMLAQLYERTGRNDLALETYESLLQQNLPANQTAAVLERMASFKMAQGAPAQAGTLYAQAYAKGHGRKPSLLLRSGEAFFTAKQYDQALTSLTHYLEANPGTDDPEAINMLGFIYTEQQHYDQATQIVKKALDSGNYSPEQNQGFLVRLGDIAFKQGRTDKGIEYLKQAINVGGETPDLRLAIGQALYRIGRNREAVRNLLRARELGGGHKVDSALAFCYDKLGKPGLALYYMEQAAHAAPQTDQQDVAAMYDQLAYLYMSQESYAQAIENYQKALDISPRQDRLLKLGRAQRLSGDPDAAKTTLQAVVPANLTIRDRAQYYEELGRIAKDKNDLAQAEMLLKKSIELDPDSERVYQLGQTQEQSARLDEAIASFHKAYTMDNYDIYAVSLGYAHYNNGDLKQAATIFKDLVNRDPDYINLAEDLAYINKRLYENADAITWFEQSINNEPFYPDQTPQSLRKKIYDFKEEIRNLSNRWDVTGFFSYSADESTTTTDGQGSRVGVLDNSAGVEVGYIPESFGFRNGKIFQIIGRASLGTKKDESLNMQSDTLQGALGIRYKPFSFANIAVGAEKLFKIGNQAENNTLLRLMGSWNNGWSMRAAEKHWNHTFVYGEVDQYVEDTRRTALTIHGRQGHTWNIDDQWLITPHLFVTYQHTSPDTEETDHIKGGPALSIRWLEGENARVSYQREWECLVRYNYGQYLSGDDSRISGLSLNLNISF